MLTNKNGDFKYIDDKTIKSKAERTDGGLSNISKLWMPIESKYTTVFIYT